MPPDPAVESVRRVAEAAWPERCPRCDGPLGFEAHDEPVPGDAGGLPWLVVLGTHLCGSPLGGTRPPAGEAAS